MDEKRKKKQIAKISVFITSIFVIVLSITYAFINMTVTGTKRQVITSGNLQIELEEDNAITLTNAMPMYDEVGMIQDSFNFRLINSSSVDTNYIVKLEDITVGDPLSKEEVKYGLTKDKETKIDFLSMIEENKIDEGTIEGNATIEYTLRLWIDSGVGDNRSISGKSLSYRIDLDVDLSSIVEGKIAKISKTAFLEKNLGENCQTYDDGVDTFLVGKCKNNYVWYSGKLWKIVLKNNETGAVKMITDLGVASIPYNESKNDSFENSYADQWLQQEFLPTLHDYEDYLITDSVWDATADGSAAPMRPNGRVKVKRPVGLLNVYEFYTTYNNSDGIATYETGYLNNAGYWWLMTPYYMYQLCYVYHSGSLLKNFGDPTLAYAIRPCVNMKSDIQIVFGDGTRENPYCLKNDSKEIINGTTLLNTMYSGDYIKFNNAIYRIVGVENNLTKITADNTPDELIGKTYHSSATGVTNFSNAAIKSDLENYYQGLASSDKNMIEPNTKWYLGTVAKGQ